MKSSFPAKQHIAILDADPAILQYVHKLLADRYTVSLYTEPEDLLQSLTEPRNPDLLMMDWDVQQADSSAESLKLLSSIHAAKPSLPIVLFMGSADLRDVVQATRRGATDVVVKPFRKADIDLALKQCLQDPGHDTGRRSAEEDPLAKEIPLNEETSLVVASKRMREIESQCRLLARADIPVLILGESGTGKEVATLFIHKMSNRAHRGFLKVNCAAMPADLLESELFGYEPGAFTGAVKAKPGKFELCDGGTVFLDEIGEMPAPLQAKLLQVLQDGSFSRLGGRATVKVDVRVIAATNVDIKAAIAQKTFREDLYYRLNGFTLKMPPLRDRMEEIPVLAKHFMCKVAAKYQREPLPFSSRLMKALASQTWPGNLRELENAVKRYLILADEQAILDDLESNRGTDGFPAAALQNGAAEGLKHLVRNVKGDAESVAIAQALEGTGWNRKVAASDLRISYKALLYKIKQYNLYPPERRQVALAQPVSLSRVQ